MEIYFAVEANILEGGKLDIRPEEAGFFDYICAGWHYGAIGGIRPSGMCSLFVNLARSTAEKASARQIRRNTDVVVKALEHNPVKFLTHPGDKAPVDILEVAAACARTDTLMEINTSHMSLTAADLRNIAVTEARFLISSDAHTPARVGDMVCAVKLLLDAGVALNRVVNLKVTEA
jgi:putative hydrolase